MLTTEQWSADQAEQGIGELCAILIDSVANGASVGFLPPLSPAAARAYWVGVVADLRQGSRRLLVARHEGRVRGTAQLALAGQPNGRHRAEVQKMMVHTSARKRGLGAALLAALDDLARQEGRTLLVLDTRQGEPSERLYQRHGYIQAGSIPAYARSDDGTFHTTVLYYRLLQ